MACLYKTRSDAQKACTGGKVEVNGQPAKQNRLIRAGDNIQLNRPHGRRQRIIVRVIANKHIAKAGARELYRGHHAEADA